jgi:hypothetical protein
VNQVDMATGQSAQDTVANRNAMMQAIIAANGSDNRLMTVSSLNQVLGCASNNYAAASAMEPGRCFLCFMLVHFRVQSPVR